MGWNRILAAGILAVLLLLAAAPVQAESFRFRSDVSSQKWSANIGGNLVMPQGNRPFPAVVLLHPCAGLTGPVRQALDAHARFLTRNGFAALILDSFGPRGLNGGVACKGSLVIPAINLLMEDAFNAMAALEETAGIDAENVFLAGQSLGATAALRAAIPAYSRRHGAFRAVAAWYPGCQIMASGAQLKSPVLVLGGGRDDWTPPDNCRRAKSRGRVTGADYEVVIYPEALHAFDQPRQPYRYKGHMLGYSAGATTDGREKMLAFFRRQMAATTQ